MTDYARHKLSIEYSSSSDYSDAAVNPAGSLTWESTPSQIQKLARISVSTGGQAIELGMFTSVDAVVVQNRDSTNYVTATFTNAASSAQSQKITAGKFAVFPDVKVSGDLTLTANTSACICDVTITGT